MTAVGSAASEKGFMHEGSGVILILGMIVMSVSIMSLIIFGCADKPRKSGGRGHGRYSGGVFYGGAAAYSNGSAFDAGGGGNGGCACGGGGHGGGGCGGGHGGGGGGGGGGGCGGGGGGGC
nr:glycine-rich protein DOT1-like [Coffea arabica]